MNDPIGKNGKCKNCQVTQRLILHRQFLASGAHAYLWVCPKCNRRGPIEGEPLYIGNEKVESFLTQEQIEALPMILPDRETRCAHCGSRDCERHHWAPKAIFGPDEAEQWPKDYLCKECHDLWHSKVTPQLVK